MIRKFGKNSLILILALIGAFSAPAASADPPQLARCSGALDAIEREDGSILALGNTYSCYPDVYAEPQWGALVGLAEDGTVLEGFGREGVVRVPSGFGRLIGRPDGGAILFGHRALRAYGPDGKPDREFGEAGRLVRPSLRNAAIAPGGRLYLLWGVPSRLSRFDLDGNPDFGFGTNGQVDLGFTADSALAVDSEGRILLGESGAEREVIRLLPDGSPDPTFGPSMNGRVELDVNPAPSGVFFMTSPIMKIEAGPDDAVYAYGQASQGDLYQKFAYIAGADEGGSSLPGLPTFVLSDKVRTVTRLGDGFAFSVHPSRFDRQFPMKIMATGWPGPAVVTFTPTMHDAEAARTLALSDGTLLAFGSTYGTVCPPRKCRTATRMAFVKLEDGNPVHSFGNRGKVVVPDNGCRWGEVDDKGYWPSCRLRPPKLRGSVELLGAKSKSPRLRIKARLGAPPEALGDTGHQKLVVVLPRWAKASPAALRRGVKVTARRRGPLSFQIRGRRVVVRYESAGRTVFKVLTAPGTIKLTPNGRKLRRPKMKLRGAFVPYPTSINSPGRTARMLNVRVK